MISNSLTLKLINRRVKNFADNISGISHYEILLPPNRNFTLHQNTIKKMCGIDSKPFHFWKTPFDENEILNWLCSRISNLNLNLNVYIPCEGNFYIYASINDCINFVRSIWNIEGTKDLTLYMTNPAIAIQLQDLEYGVAYFEFHICETE